MNDIVFLLSDDLTYYGNEKAATLACQRIPGKEAGDPTRYIILGVFCGNTVMECEQKVIKRFPTIDIQTLQSLILKF